MARKELITILDPGPEASSEVGRAMTPPSLGQHTRIALLGNGKANADHLLMGIEQGLRTTYGLAAVRRYDKGRSNIPIPAGMLAEIATSADLVVLAVAD